MQKARSVLGKDEEREDVSSTDGRLTSDREKQYYELELFVVMNAMC